jgi:hypothetical protein
MSAGRSVNSKSKNWGTPIKYIVPIRNFFRGNISLDPCSNEYSIVNAETEYRLPKTDGLVEEWDYPTIFVNPPYGSDRVRGTTIRNWLEKCDVSNKLFDSEIIALVPVAPNTRHWKNHIFTRATAICFLSDTRLKFLENGKEGGKGAPMSCSLIYWGDSYQKFYDVFIEYGAVVDIRHLHGNTK